MYFNVNQIDRCIYLTMKLLITISMLTVLRGKNYVLVKLISEFMEIETCLRHTFLYVDKITAIQE